MIGARIYQAFSGGGIPFQSDLALNFYERQYADFLEKISSDNIKVLPSCGLVDANNYLLKSVANFESSDASGWVEAELYCDGVSTGTQIFTSGDESVSTRYFDCQIAAGAPRIICRNTAAGFNNIITTGESLPAGKYTIRYGSTGTSYYIIVNGVNKNLIATSGANDGKWLNLITGRDNVAIGVLKGSSLITSTLTKIYSVNYSDKNKWYLNGKGKYEYDTIGNLNLTWTGTAHIAYDENASRHYMDNGWYLFKKTGEVDEQVPISATTTDIEALGYAKPVYGSFASSLKSINMANCYIDFSATSNPIFDRSNETTNSVISRASSYYLASNPYRWHISEISDPRKYMEYLNVGYAGKFYGGITTYLSSGEYYIKMLNFMLLYTTDKTGADQYKIMQYCGTNVFADI